MRLLLSWSAALALSAALACAPTNVQTQYENDTIVSRPQRVLVYDFAFAPDQVQLGTGVAARVQQAMSATPPTEKEIQVGRAVAQVISNQLVEKINAMGLPAQRAWGAPRDWAQTVVIEGQLLSVNEGNRTERLVIGLGAGHSDVESEVQVYATSPRGLQRLADFSASARSGYKPGAAETMGAGAAMGAVGTAAAVTAGTGVLSETLSADVNADAKRLADKVAAQLQGYFQQQGWIQIQ